MIYKIGDSIISPLAWTSAENLAAVLRGESRACYHEGVFGLPEPFFGSLIDDIRLDNAFNALTDYGLEGYSKVEKAAIVAAAQAIAEANIDAANENVLFVFSTTKGNVSFLGSDPKEPETIYLWHTARKITDFFNNSNLPLIVSNACISGCAAQIAACRQLQYGGYKYAVVVGAEMLSKFVISGFQSFKALSKERCKPFSADRCGLNLGEAAAAIVYTIGDDNLDLPNGTMIVESGAINNDANHISGPSRTGEGLLRSITHIMNGTDPQRIAFINAHGTATLYNDDMESIAIQRAGLQNVPVNSLKGYFGHTLGAAGILETILSAHALQQQTVIKTLGTQSTETEINVCLENRPAHGDQFLKLISGFGGSNAAMRFSVTQQEHMRRITNATPITIRTNNAKSSIKTTCQINNHEVLLNSKTIFQNRTNNEEWLTHIYRHFNISYPKFFKMDPLCKAGFLGAEILLKGIDFDRENVKSDWAILLMNSASSLENDRHYQETIANKENYYPSPAIFVYTLANIVTGEIAIRHKVGGETAFYIAQHFSEIQMEQLVEQLFASRPNYTHILCGWVDVDKEVIDVRMRLCER